MGASTEISNHPEPAKHVERLPLPSFSVNLVILRFQKSRGLLALLWILFCFWNKLCCALQTGYFPPVRNLAVYGVPAEELHLLECCQVWKVLLEWGDSEIPAVKLMNRQMDSVQTFFFFAFLSLFLDLEPLFSWFELMPCNKVVAWTNYISMSGMPVLGVLPPSCSSGRALSWQDPNTPFTNMIKML